jgi:hypothetical protein
MKHSRCQLLVLLAALSVCGCQSPFYADRGAAQGGLLGGGIGAVIGNQSGNAAEGALVGGAIGALTGGAIGATLDDIDARNRAMIAQQIGRAPQAGAVPISDVIVMSQSGVSDQLIIAHIQANGVATPPTAQDLITLNQAGVADTIVLAMQTPPPPRPANAIPGHTVPAAYYGPPPVFVEEHYYGPGRRPFHHHRPPHGHLRPGVSFGVSYSD